MPWVSRHNNEQDTYCLYPKKCNRTNLSLARQALGGLLEDFLTINNHIKWAVRKGSNLQFPIHLILRPTLSMDLSLPASKQSLFLRTCHHQEAISWTSHSPTSSSISKSSHQECTSRSGITHSCEKELAGFRQSSNEMAKSVFEEIIFFRPPSVVSSERGHGRALCNW